jgi:hypothetical protein
MTHTPNSKLTHRLWNLKLFMIYALKIIYTHYSWYMCLKLYGTIGVPLLELIVRNIARYPQSATSTPIRYQPAIRYLVPWGTVKGGIHTDSRKGWVHTAVDKQPNTQQLAPLVQPGPKTGNQTKYELNQARFNSPTKQVHVVLLGPGLHYLGSNPSQIRI